MSGTLFPLPEVPLCTHKGTAKRFLKTQNTKNKVRQAAQRHSKNIRARARTRNEERIGLNFFCILENSLTKLTNEN